MAPFAHRACGKLEISERHRHRHEFNRQYDKILTNAGLLITGRTPDENYVEIIEAPNHPCFLGCPAPPRIQVQAPGAAPAICRLYRRLAGKQAQQVARHPGASPRPSP